MKLTEQAEVKKYLIDLMADYKSQYFHYNDTEYINELIEKITDDSSMQVIKTHLMNLYDCTSDDLIIVTIKKIIYDMNAIQEAHEQSEVVGDVIELENNIKLNKLVTELIYKFLNYDIDISIRYKGKYIIIEWDTESDSGIHIVTNLDLFMYENTINLIEKLQSVVVIGE